MNKYRIEYSIYSEKIISNKIYCLYSINKEPKRYSVSSILIRYSCIILKVDQANYSLLYFIW
ncbi:hypothetical protein ECANGB1_257 [Enterospora canceri]|uniref:Uncharacterized protein n=1 Tax=Enterospora canceri TaxID=1081671 RepID=A0A1Y1S4I9_9MICR|nr:hypothetical protein ECANGB1_257 [Enterospora canceri]